MNKEILMNVNMLFNDIHDVTSSLGDDPQYEKPLMHMVYLGFDDKERAKYNQKKGNSTQHNYSIMQQVIHHDPLDYFINSGERMFKVYGGSMLYQALDAYAKHISKINKNIHTSNPIKDFVRSYYQDIHGNGTFLFEGGTGYDIHDELFAGVPLTKKHAESKHPSKYSVGSGFPTQRFIRFLQKNVNVKLV